MTRTQVFKTISEYFALKGHFMTAKEYKLQPDIPISVNLVLRVVGSWQRLPVNIQRYFPELASKIDFSAKNEVYIPQEVVDSVIPPVKVGRKR